MSIIVNMNVKVLYRYHFCHSNLVKNTNIDHRKSIYCCNIVVYGFINTFKHEAGKAVSIPAHAESYLSIYMNHYMNMAGTLVVQVALRGSMSRSSLCRTAAGHREARRANIRNVNICRNTEKEE